MVMFGPITKRLSKKHEIQLKATYKGKLKTIPKIPLLIYPHLNFMCEIEFKVYRRRLTYENETKFLEDWIIE